MIQQCAWCGRLRVRREPHPVLEGEPELGPTEGVAWLAPADPTPVESGLVSHGICPRCAAGMALPVEFDAENPGLGAWPGHGAARVRHGDTGNLDSASDGRSCSECVSPRRQNKEGATDG